MNDREVLELAWFRYPTHTVYVYQHCDSGHIHCLKYNNVAIQWEHYTYEQWETCKEYMIVPMEPAGYQLVSGAVVAVCN